MHVFFSFKQLLISLNETKSSSNAITQALIESQDLQLKLEEEYDIYKDISLFGSSLYFAANEYSKLNILYTLSVNAYSRLFLRSLPSQEVCIHIINKNKAYRRV